MKKNKSTTTGRQKLSTECKRVEKFSDEKKRRMRRITEFLRDRQLFYVNFLNESGINSTTISKTIGWHGSNLIKKLEQEVCADYLLKRVELGILYIMLEKDLNDQAPTDEENKYTHFYHFLEQKKEWKQNSKYYPKNLLLKDLKFMLACEADLYVDMTYGKCILDLNILYQSDQMKKRTSNSQENEEK